MAAHYSIAAVARLTGLSVDTLRAWERRYGAVEPVRDARGRVYTGEHVRRLQRLAKLVENGHAIGRIAALPDRSLAKLLDDAVEAESAAEQPAGIDLAPLLDAMTRYDLPAVDALLMRHALLLAPSQFIFSVVLPAMRAVGDRWAAGTIRPAHEHLLSAVVRSVLGALLRTMPPRPGASTLVCATPAGEHHELGLLCAAVLAASAGLNVIYLGPDLPVDDIVHATTSARAQALLVSSTIEGATDRKELHRLSRVPNGTAIWAGGAHAADVRAAVGRRVELVATLEDLTAAVERHVA